MQKYELYLKQPSNFLKNLQPFLSIPLVDYVKNTIKSLIPYKLRFSY